MAVERPHLRREVEQPETLLEVHEGVVAVFISGGVREAVTELDGLADIVVALLDARRLVLRPRTSREGKRRQQSRKAPGENPFQRADRPRAEWRFAHCRPP